MNKENWKYKLGGDPGAFVPLGILLAVFGGVSVWLYVADNGAFLFTGVLTALVLCLAASSLYRCLFVKLFIGKEGFYHQSAPGNGHYYAYEEIAEAWKSEGRARNGAVSAYLHYRTEDGAVIRFPFVPAQTEAVAYLLRRVRKTREAADEKAAQ